MLKTLLVIQKVNENGNVEIFQAYSESKPFHWTFETKRKQIKNDKEFFPFIISDVKVIKRNPGSETITKVNNNQIKFYDDYSIPDGSVIAVLFPTNFIPDIIKFKENPYIPTGLAGQVSTRPPGQIQIRYNKLEKKCAIIMHIHENVSFGIKLLAKKVSDESFPNNENDMADDLFDVSISRKFLNVDSIKTEDLKIINKIINQTDLSEINNTLNDILNALKNGDKGKAQSLLSKFGKLIISGSSLVNNLLEIEDSYNNGSAVHQFIRKVIEYVKL